MAVAMAIDLGKENICPLAQLSHSKTRVQSIPMEPPHSSRRSPLPVGFPRSPLQDITHHILTSPVALNCTQIFPDEKYLVTLADSCQSGSKRFKSTDSSQSSSCTCLEPCTSLLTGIRVSSCLDRESERKVIKENSSNLSQSSSSSSSSARTRVSSFPSSDVKENVFSTKRKQISFSVKSANSSFSIVPSSNANNNTVRSEAKPRSNVLKFR